jgi:DNA-binding transcriptional ArsR family regulator
MSLETIFGSRVRARLLGWIFTRPDEAFFVRQLAALIKEDSANLSRELARLEEAGILTSFRIGNLKYFRADTSCPFHLELKGLVRKAVGGLAGQLRPLLEPLDGLRLALIHGPGAKDEAQGTEDLGLMLVGDLDREHLAGVMAAMEQQLDRRVNYLIYAEEEFAVKKRAGDKFLSEILKGPIIMLWGTRNDLGGL